MESRENLFKQYKKDWPQTVGETDKVFDNDNFIDWLCQQTKALTDEIDGLKSRISELEKANTNLEMQKAEVELENKDIKSILIKMSDKVVYTLKQTNKR